MWPFNWFKRNRQLNKQEPEIKLPTPTDPTKDKDSEGPQWRNPQLRNLPKCYRH